MWRWKFDPRLSSPPAQVPTHCPGGASREGSAPAWEGKEQGVQCSVRLQGPERDLDLGVGHAALRLSLLVCVRACVVERIIYFEIVEDS